MVLALLVGFRMSFGSASLMQWCAATGSGDNPVTKGSSGHRPA